MRRLAVLAVALAALPLVGAQAAGDPPLRVPRAALAKALVCPSRFSHPKHEPVLLVHGTGFHQRENYDWNYAVALPQAGFDVCSVTLPNRALDDIQVASEYVVYAVREMHRRTRRRVDVIGHSQGGLEPRWALRWWPSLRRLVDDLVTLAAPHHGTLSADALANGGSVAAAYQMRTDSRFVRALNSGDETPGGVSYTALYSLTDELVQPAAPVPTGALKGGRNVLVQDVCPGRVVTHVSIAGDGVVWELVRDALTRRGPADPKRLSPTVCATGAMPGFTPTALVAVAQDDFENDRTPDWNFVDEEPALAPYARY